MLLPTLPLYAQTLGGKETLAGTIVGLFTLSAVLVRPWFGNMLDRKGRKLILIIGVGIFFVSALAYNIAFSIITLLALRVIHGIGWGASTTATGYALHQGLEVWFSPALVDATELEMLHYFDECAKAAEKLRLQSPHIVFVAGCEL